MMRGSNPSTGKRLSLFPQHSDQLWGPPIVLFRGVLRAVSPGVKWLGHEADHLSPSSAKDKNEWSYLPTPTYVFVVYRDNFAHVLWSCE
jgi:hypothetical protein